MSVELMVTIVVSSVGCAWGVVSYIDGKVDKIDQKSLETFATKREIDKIEEHLLRIENKIDRLVK